MTYLLDTNVISDPVKARPDPSVTAWLSNVDEEFVFLSVIVFAEIRRGIELIEDGPRRDRLWNWLALDLPQASGGAY